MQKNLVFIIKANQEYIRYTENDVKKNYPLLNKFFDSISTTYIPLLRMFEKFEAENVTSKIGLVLPPVLCALLEATEIQDLYAGYLENRIEMGEKEIVRCKDNPDLLKIAETTLSNYKTLLQEFTEKYEKKLVKQFAMYHKKGFVELLATTGTEIFVPHYADMPEIISAQVETGLHAFRKYFGENPEGFWLSGLGYTPGVEKIIKAYGFSYTILDSKAFLLADDIPSKGIFYPAKVSNSLVVFPSYYNMDEELYGEEGLSANKVYKHTNRDIGFELNIDELAAVEKEGTPRISTGYGYWNKESDSEAVYNEAEALAQLDKDAEFFLNGKKELLTKAEDLLQENDYVSLVCTINADSLTGKWVEGIAWLEKVLRKTSDFGISAVTCNSLIDKAYHLEKVEPCYSAATGTGYGEDFLSSKNCWMVRYTRKASERIVDLVDRFLTDTGLKTRLLNIGSIELMIAQSSCLAKMIDDGEFAEYAEERFKESIKNFTMVFDSLGSNVVSTEWLTTLEVKDNLFPWMNYRIFSRKK